MPWCHCHHAAVIREGRREQGGLFGSIFAGGGNANGCEGAGAQNIDRGGIFCKWIIQGFRKIFTTVTGCCCAAQSLQKYQDLHQLYFCLSVWKRNSYTNHKTSPVSPHCTVIQYALYIWGPSHQPRDHWSQCGEVSRKSINKSHKIRQTQFTSG